MYVLDYVDPCQGGRRWDCIGKTKAMIQAEYWGKIKYRIKVTLKNVEARCTHDYFEYAKQGMQ